MRHSPSRGTQPWNAPAAPAAVGEQGAVYAQPRSLSQAPSREPAAAAAAAGQGCSRARRPRLGPPGFTFDVQLLGGEAGRLLAQQHTGAAAAVLAWLPARPSGRNRRWGPGGGRPGRAQRGSGRQHAKRHGWQRRWADSHARTGLAPPAGRATWRVAGRGAPIRGRCGCRRWGWWVRAGREVGRALAHAERVACWSCSTPTRLDEDPQAAAGHLPVLDPGPAEPRPPGRLAVHCPGPGAIPVAGRSVHQRPRRTRRAGAAAVLGVPAGTTGLLGRSTTTCSGRSSPQEDAPEAAGFSRPVRIIFGAADPYLNSGVARRFHELFPGSELFLLPGARIMCRWTSPRRSPV